MHISIRKVLLTAFTAFVGLAAGAVTVAPTSGVIRVKLQPELVPQVGVAPRIQTMGTLSTGITPLDRATSTVKATKLRPMLPYSEKFAEKRAKYGLDRWYVVEFDESVSPDQARKVFAATPGVERSEVIIPMELKEGNGNFVVASAPVPMATNDMPFNDPRLADQWHYQNTGRIANSVAGADINLFDAWKISTGNPEVLVAIIDGGIDYQHEDLAANMAINLAELNGTPGVDDDGNGWVDDIYGYNFCTNSGDVYPHTHGTHVAGTVAAVNNNGKGVAGVAGGDGSKNSGVRLISCQVFDSRSGSGDSDFASAFVYACERGATIAQCSWGWGAEGYYEQAVLDAIDYFTNEASSSTMTGGLAIFAAGNMGETGNWYPGCIDNVVAVGAMTAALTPASYSNYGSWVDIMAPGGLLEFDGGVLSTLPNNAYGYNEGTSMATPHVSGIAALILSKYGSTSFVNETLRTQLLTSVNDFYGYGNNARYEGLFGAGYIDAVKALNMGTGEAPAAVSDLKADAAQDYIDLVWTIPASSDNNVNNHIIYYSTEPFTAQTDLSTLSHAIVDTKFLSSGMQAGYEIAGLDSKTTYYIAIVAVNRWGIASPMSEVISITTNDGPAMTVATPSVSMEADAANHLATGTITIGNEGEGILKWSAGKRTVSARPQSVSRPTVLNAKPYSGKLATTAIKPMAATAATAEYEADEYPKDIKYYSTVWAYIGDSDRSLPCSMAQWFKVDADEHPNGFNLTHFKIDGYGQGKNPVVEIYRGDAPLSSATLLEKLEDFYFYYTGMINLKEQLFFAPGESFWIVVHFEGNQEGYPLTMALADKDNISSYSYMSTDKGKSWSTLAQALVGSAYESNAAKYTWGITARSLNPDWSELIELAPATGTVRNGETQDITASIDGSKLVNGWYEFNVLIKTNEGKGKTVSVPASLTVKDNPHNVVVPKVVDFGNILVGETKKVSVEVYNKGFGGFRGSEWGAGVYEDGIKVSNDNFVGPDYLGNGFPARSNTSFEVTFAPKAAGTHSGTLTFTDYQGKTVRILLQGNATEPAKLALDPAVIDAGTLTVGDEPLVKTFNITNEGKYPLEYVFPRFSDETIDGVKASNHKYGYTVFANLEGFADFEYDGGVNLIGATDIARKFTDSEYISGPISMGFQFPYYGKSYEKVYITSYGAVMFNTPEDGVNFWPPLSATSASIDGTGMIAAYGSKLDMGPDSHVTYAKQDGKFIVNFQNVLAVVYDTEKTPISFHIVLSANGDIEIHYDSYEAYLIFQDGSGLFCGINDPELNDCLTVTSNDMADYWGNNEPTPDNQRFNEFTSGTAVKFEAPKPLFVTSLEPAYGLVSPGETIEVTATLAANENLDAGASFNKLAIVTNDPAPAYGAVRFDAIIAGEGLVPVAALDENSYELGDIFRTATVQVPVTVKNAGHDVMTLTAIEQTNSEFSYAIELPVEIAAGMSKDVVFTVPTAQEGAVNTTITFTTNAGQLTATIEANIIGCPAIAVDPESIEESVVSGEPLSKTLTISNDGNETLSYSVIPGSLYSLSIPDKSDNKTAYSYASSLDSKEVKYDWVDIETNGLGTRNSLTYYLSHDYVEVELPFEFPFYGKKYNKMYVYNTGFVSFTKRADDKLWPEPPAEFPQGTIYTNIIAPYWGLHSMDQTSTAGTYHYVTDDTAIVSFMEYGNTMNLGVCFQLIMHKDGTFKFQYKGKDPYESVIFGIFGLAGISDEFATQSERLPERMVTFNSAVEFSPIVEINLPAGEKDEIEVAFDTNRMGGIYTGSINIESNVPASEKLEVPVMLQIQGQPIPVFPSMDEPIVIEHTIGYMSTDWNDPFVQMGVPYAGYFEIANAGTSEFTILNIHAEGPAREGDDDDFDPMFGGGGQIFNLWYYGPGVDWWGEPTEEYQWQQYYEGMTQPSAVGSTPAKFAFPMMDPDTWYTPGEYEIQVMVVYYAGSIEQLMMEDDPDYEMAMFTVKFVVTDVPLMFIDNTEGIYVKANDEEFTTTETINIANYGEYKLTYELIVDLTGEGEPMEPGYDEPWIEPLATKAGNAPAPVALADGKIAAPAVPAATSDNVFNCPANFEYRNAVFYPVMESGSPQVFNYGTGSLYENFIAATAFKAPAEGFNMSHLYLPVTIWNGYEDGFSSKDIDIRFTVVKGNDPAGTEIMGRGSLFLAEQQTMEGSFNVIPLNRSVYIAPDQEFCVVVSYPAGVTYPGYLMAKEEKVIPGRYMGWREASGWFDVAELFSSQYGSLGWVMSCLETKEGEPWVKILNPETSGEIEPMEDVNIDIKISAASAPLEGINQAMLVVKSNDPLQPVVNIPVVLESNLAPVIEGNNGVTVAREGETTLVTMTVFDPDFDDFVIEYNDPSALSSIVSVEAAQGDMATIEGEEVYFEVSGATEPVTVTIKIEPEFGWGGESNAYTLLAYDQFNHTTTFTGRYNVERVNRAPITVDAMAVEVAVGQVSAPVTYAELFSDPDGDELKYTLDFADNDIADAYTTSTGVIFVGKKEGNVKATITATDPEGETCEHVLDVVVTTPSGIDSIEADGSDDDVIYYNLQGIRVYKPAPGYYLVKRGLTVTKEYIER